MKKTFEQILEEYLGYVAYGSVGVERAKKEIMFAAETHYRNRTTPIQLKDKSLGWVEVPSYHPKRLRRKRMFNWYYRWRNHRAFIKAWDKRGHDGIN